MASFTEQISTALVVADEPTQRALADGIATFQRMLENVSEVNWAAGSAQIDERALVSAAEGLQRATSFAVGTRFARDLADTARQGFAVVDGNGRDVVPWESLSDRTAVGNLSESRLQALGAIAGPADVVRSEIAARFAEVPGTVDAGAAGNLITALRDRRVAGAALRNRERLSELINGGDDSAVTGIAMAMPDKPDGGHPSGGGVGGTIIDIGKLVSEFVTDCLPHLRFHQPNFSTGPGIEMDRDCALRLSKILSTGGAGPLTTAGLAAIAAGSVSAAVTAALTAVGGWPALIVAACLLVFSGWLQLVVTDNGVCIHFPWWAGFGPICYGL